VQCFIDGCLSFCPFPFGHCVVCPSFKDADYMTEWTEEKGQKEKENIEQKTKDRVSQMFLLK
jgi:hypothetical protein